MKSRPDDIGAVETLADLHRVQKNWPAAVQTYSRGIELLRAPQPADWRWFYFRGVAYERSKDWPPAEADFRKALELNPEQPQVLNYLAYTWADMGVNLEEARVMLEKAVSLAREDGHIADSLGWVYYRLGRYEDALRELERAIGKTPGRGRGERAPGRRVLETRSQAGGGVQMAPRARAQTGARGSRAHREEAPGRRAGIRRRRSLSALGTCAGLLAGAMNIDRSGYSAAR